MFKNFKWWLSDILIDLSKYIEPRILPRSKKNKS